MKTERKATVWDRVRATANLHGAAIDEQIDLFVGDGCKGKFSTAKYLKGYELSTPVVRLLAEFYRPHLEELRLAASGEDAELREAYRLTDKQLERYVEFVASIVRDCDAVIEKSATQRKPRAKKVIPPEVLVKSMKGRMEYPELGLSGLSPSFVVGAQEAWFYDTEKRRLMQFRAKDLDGLSVKGTTILNFNEGISGSKVIRKPEVFFKEHLIGIKSFTRAWPMIRGKVLPVKGRTNDNMILLVVG